IEAAITRRTRALIPVDLAGLPVDRERLAQIAQRHGLRVIEDAAQSFGARWAGRQIGSFRDPVSFSVPANKNIPPSQGGRNLLNDEDEAARLERLRLQGVVRLADGGMEVSAWGAKANLTDVAAAIGLGQLRQEAGFAAARKALAERYFARWDAPDFELPLAG